MIDQRLPEAINAAWKEDIVGIEPADRLHVWMKRTKTHDALIDSGGLTGIRLAPPVREFRSAGLDQVARAIRRSGIEHRSDDSHVRAFEGIERQTEKLALIQAWNRNGNAHRAVTSE